MEHAPTRRTSPSVRDSQDMHEVYRRGGKELQVAPHVVYEDGACPHPGCGRRMQAIDFRLERYGKDVHDTLVRAWWEDTGFAGRCPGCGRWIHFTIRDKRAIDEKQVLGLPRLPDDWHSGAVVL